MRLGLAVAVGLGAMLAASGCRTIVVEPDAAADAGPRPDTGPRPDAGPDEPDTGPPPMDAGPTLDAMPDAMPTDAVADDAGDASLDAAIELDAGPDAGRPDSGPGSCTVTFFTAEFTTGRHVDTCSDVVYDTVPPHSGAHYGSWADFKTYTAPVPWGYLVHSMEHGAIVLAYDCPAGCPGIVSALETFVADYPADPLCTAPLRHRLILVPDPTLDVPIAAAAWGHTYRATCLDLRTLRLFVDSVYGLAPENFCSAGIDLSDTGWCPAPPPP